MNKSRTLIIGAVAIGIALFVLILVGVLPGLNSNEVKNNPISISVWGIGNDNEFFVSSAEILRTEYPNFSVQYRGFSDEESYNYALSEAFSLGKAPDIIMVSNADIPKMKSKIAQIPQQYITQLQLQQTFPETVWRYDFADKNGVYALPFTIDTLVLFYNRDILGNAGFVYPPETWELLEEMIPTLTKKNATGTLEQSAIALGGTEQTIAHASDILASLMLRSGTKMVSDDFSRASFNSKEGETALQFYTKFSDPKSKIYTWNETMSYSLDAFASEQVAMIIGYERDIKILREKNKNLNFGIASIPQPKSATKTLTYPSYYGYAITQQSKQKAIAATYLVRATLDKTTAQKYVEKVGGTPILLSLINENISSTDKSVFARQALVARGYPQIDSIEIRTIFSEMIQLVISGTKTIVEALNEGQTNVNKLFSRIRL
ncbi:MAG: extracellular solute-binding protein [Candidatus Paceibacterota bacterium]|jgi:ABC-type glycerol-3-phosphate transport system substrate-binding protein